MVTCGYKVGQTDDHMRIQVQTVTCGHKVGQTEGHTWIQEQTDGDIRIQGRTDR